MPRAPQFILSVDVEDYFQVEAFARQVSRTDWDNYPSRVVANTQRTLDLFDEFGVKGTFFVLGWVARKFPALVAEIQNRGHELACHSFWHRPVYSLTPEAFRRGPAGIAGCDSTGRRRRGCGLPCAYLVDYGAVDVGFGRAGGGGFCL